MIDPRSRPRHPQLSFRSPLSWLLILALAVGWLCFGPRSETIVELGASRDQLVGSVNGVSLALDAAANPLPISGTLQLYTAPPETSQYYQHGEPNGPLAFLGGVGEVIQRARPSASLRLLETPVSASSTLGSATQLGGRPPGPYRVRVDVAGGRVASGLVVGAPDGPQYAFVVRPERRTLSWWTFSDSRLVDRLSSSFYRVGGWATAADLMEEFALLLIWTALLALAAIGLGRLLPGRLLISPGTSALAQAGAPHPEPLPKRGGAQALASVETEEWPGSIDVSSALPIREVPSSHPYPSWEERLRRSDGGGRPPRTSLGWSIPLWVLFCGFLTFFAALWATLGPLEGIPHVQDDVAYIFQAKIFALRMAWAPAPPLPQFFEHNFILIHEGRWFAKYPPGFPLLLAPAEVLRLRWLVNPLCAGLAIVLVYLTGRAIYGHRAALWAALLGAFSPFVIFMSGSFMSHPSTLFWLTLFLYCFVRSIARLEWLADPPRLREGKVAALAGIVFPLVGGFAAGWAFITREATTVGVLAAFAIWALIDLGAALPRGGRALARGFRPYLLMALGAVPPLLVMGWVNQQQMGSPFRLAQELVGSYDRLGFGAGFGPEPEGHSPAIGIYNALVYLRELQAALFGWPLLLTMVPVLLALLAAVSSWRRGEGQWRWDLLVLGGFLGLVGIYLLWWSSTAIFGPRYWYEGTPFLLLLAGRGLAWLGELSVSATGPARPEGALATARETQNLPARGGSADGGSVQRQRPGIWIVPGLLVALLMLYNLTQYFPGEVRKYTGYNDVTASALRRVEEASLRDALVFVALEPAFWRRDYGKVFFANDPLLRGPVVYARDSGAEQNRKLLEHFPGRQPYYLPLNGPVLAGFGP